MRSRDPISDPAAAAMAGAAALHRRGALDEAAAQYRDIVRNHPSHAAAFYQLAQISCQQGQFDQAIISLRQALSIAPAHAHAHLLLGRAIAERGDPAAGLVSIDRAIALEPGFADAHGCRGDVLVHLGRLPEAIESYQAAIAADPAAMANWCNLAAAQADAGHTDGALASYGRVIAARPEFVEAHFGRAAVLAGIGQNDEALAGFERGLALLPDHAPALVSCGDVLRALGRPGDALTRYDRALLLAPQDVAALTGHSAALVLLARHGDALASLDRALALAPPDADALCNRGFLLQALNRYDEALASLDQALAIDPRHAGALNNRGMVLLDLGRPAEAVASYQQAMAIRPTPGTHTNLIFALNFDPDAGPADHQAERRRWNEQHAKAHAATYPRHRNDPAPDRRLRIGYLSSHFRHQAATYAFANVILGRDRDHFDAVCYANAPVDDEVGVALRSSADQWRQIEAMGDDVVAELIKADQIDILVDLVGHMSGQRLLVFARKPAPLQVTAWGEPTGTGLDAMDYLLADSVLVPADLRAAFAERVHDLPNFLGYWTPTKLPEPSPLPALARGFVTFGSFNRAAKIQDPVIRRWAAILRKLPTARLVIKSEQPLDRSSRSLRLAQILASEGVAAERVELRGPCGRVQHFAGYQDIDIALDPFPHGGGMTTLDALWMGVPVVTAPGRTVSSRLAAASLTALGLTDFMAASAEDYVNLAVAKTRDLAALARLRSGLRERIAKSAIGAPVRYARAVETAYRTMWRAWCHSVTNG